MIEPASGWNLPPGCSEWDIDRNFGADEDPSLSCPVSGSPVLDVEAVRCCLQCEERCDWVEENYPLALRAYPLCGGGCD